MSYACLNIKPMKMTVLAGQKNHVYRRSEDKRQIKGVDPKETDSNKVIYQEKNWELPTHSRNGTRLRKDANLVASFILQASPEWYGGMNKKQREEYGNLFAKRVTHWAIREYKSDVVSSVLHLDEKTPHVHLWVCPRVKLPNGQTASNYREVFSGDGNQKMASENFHRLHDEYSLALKDLGLVRGDKNSTRIYTAKANRKEEERAQKMKAVLEGKKPRPEKTKVRVKELRLIQKEKSFWLLSPQRKAAKKAKEAFKQKKEANAARKQEELSMAVLEAPKAKKKRQAQLDRLKREKAEAEAKNEAYRRLLLDPEKLTRQLERLETKRKDQSLERS